MNRTLRYVHCEAIQGVLDQANYQLVVDCQFALSSNIEVTIPQVYKQEICEIAHIL